MKRSSGIARAPVKAREIFQTKITEHIVKKRRARVRKQREVLREITLNFYLAVSEPCYNTVRDAHDFLEWAEEDFVFGGRRAKN